MGMTMVKAEPRNALPVELTSFVGRRQELGDIRRLLAGSRMLTLTGMGGVGKTRLALRTAAGVRRAFPDGVWFVELAALSDPQLLPHTVASALGLDHVSEAPLADLADHLQDKQLLLVLDNCEHLTEACAVVASKLLAAAPGLHVLATSRHVLGVEGEQVLAIPPLSTPGDVDGRAGDAMHYEAVALLADRASAVDPGFRVTDENRDGVVELCRRLDGLPLALELAAVWLRALSPAEVLDRLEDRFSLLTSARRAVPARQQALETAVAWSFDLCSPEEQVLWTRLSVFSGGFDLQAAEEVCTGEGLARADVLPCLAGLVDKSIVGREHDLERGAAWYRMLETIRTYGAGRLAPPQARSIRLRHRDHYRRLAAAFGAEFFTPHQAEWYVRMAREHSNVRTALDFCLTEPGEGSAALDIAAPLWPWWHAGHVHEGYRYLLRGLERSTEPTRSRGDGLIATVNLAIHLSEFDRARALLAEARELAVLLGDELLASRVKQCEGHLRVHSGHPAEAVPFLEAARADARRLGATRDEWRIVHLHALAMMFLGDPLAEDLSREVLELAGRHDAESSQGWALWGLGLAQWRAGRYREAALSLRDGVRRFLPMNNLDGLSVCVEGLAWCAASASPDEHAARLLGAAGAVWRAIGGNASQAVYRDFGRLAQEQVRSAIGDRRFEAAFAQGVAFSTDQAVALALSSRASSDRGSVHAPGRPPSTAAPGGLTRREWEIAQLLAEGLSNKEIAARLVIAPRTAETHVEHILTKLGFTSRTQASAWVLDQQGR
jgi:predicted ATPase/DNA-binding CsgD family transcriptional regulator